MIIVVLGSSLVMLLWAICYPLILLSIPYAPLMQTAFLRALLGGAFLILCALVLQRPFPRSLRAWAGISVIGITATSIGFWGMFYAGSMISPGLATVLTNTQPLIASIIAGIVLKEHITQAMRISIILGFVGIIAIGINGSVDVNTQTLEGIMYVISAAISIAISNILLKKLANKIDVFYAMGAQLMIGALPLFFLASPLDIKVLFEEDLNYFWILLGLAIPGTAMPFLLWYWLMDKAPLSQLNIFSFLTPIFGLTLGWVYFAESLSSWQWSGVIIVIIAIIISVLPMKPNKLIQLDV
tara:strand:+ start:2286 stop:3179 length:894 start_codon:yes stop_codon:yes gene_type:complete